MLLGPQIVPSAQPKTSMGVPIAAHIDGYERTCLGNRAQTRW